MTGRHELAELRATLDSTGDGVIVVDSSGRVTRMSPVASRLTGWSELEAVGELLDEVFRTVEEHSGARVESPATRILRGDDPGGGDADVLLTARGGASRPITVRAAVVRDDEGAVGGVVLVFHDETLARAARRAEEEHKAHIRFLNNLARIDQVIKRATDVEEILRQILETVYSIFDCDRVWLLYPCDPEASAFRVPMEVYRPEYPGANLLDVDIPMSPAVAANMREALASDEPVIFTVGTDRPINPTTAAFHVQSQMFTPVTPKVGRPWVFGMHQCSHARIWTQEEARLYTEIARRLSDGLSSVLVLRELRENEERFRATFEQAAVGIAHAGADGRWLRVNQKLCDIVGYTREELLRRTFQDITHPDDLEGSMEFVRRLLAGEITTYSFEKRYIRKDGSFAWIDLTVSLVHSATGSPAYFICVVEDIARRKETEEEKQKLQMQLLHAQKMDSVGRLAGGVAHDFNNMLGVILGHSELALRQVDGAHPLQANLETIRQAGQRAADLTRQLLAFARKQTVSPQVLDLNQTVAAMLSMLLRLIGEDIELVSVPGPDLWLVKLDPSQVDQILANLCVNARDASGGVGKITIETSNVTFDDVSCRIHGGFVPGEYVQLAVSDCGSGMSKEVLERLFEPFFTTKGIGQGTGLGLSTVYGIVKQNLGFIDVYSEPDLGTTFKIFLPRHVGVQERIPEDSQPQGVARGRETILVVEDEPALLTLAVEMLEILGYRVLAAGTPARAIKLAEEHRTEIDLLLTDVVMPEMTGPELGTVLFALRPGLKRLFMSGYTADIIAHRGILSRDVRFIQKPFSLKELSMKVREALGEAG